MKIKVNDTHSNIYRVIINTPGRRLIRDIL